MRHFCFLWAFHSCARLVSLFVHVWPADGCLEALWFRLTNSSPHSPTPRHTHTHTRSSLDGVFLAIPCTVTASPEFGKATHSKKKWGRRGVTIRSADMLWSKYVSFLHRTKQKNKTKHFFGGSTYKLLRFPSLPASLCTVPVCARACQLNVLVTGFYDNLLCRERSSILFFYIYV